MANKKQKQSSQKSAAAEVPPPLAPFLGRELRVELQDGRVIVGTLLAYEGSGDLVLQAALEERHYKEDTTGAVCVRGINLLAIPFKFVKTLHRRKDGNATLTAALEQELEMQQQQLQEKQQLAEQLKLQQQSAAPKA